MQRHAHVTCPRPLMQEWSWQFQGECKDYPIEMFFPDGRGRHLQRLEDAAKRICRKCPVLASCRDHALRAPEAYGIWGALTSRERAHLLSTPPEHRGPTDG